LGLFSYKTKYILCQVPNRITIYTVTVLDAFKTKATVDPTQITVSNSTSGGATDYKLTIRRSTKRFVETYELENRMYTESGHCAVFD